MGCKVTIDDELQGKAVVCGGVEDLITAATIKDFHDYGRWGFDFDSWEGLRNKYRSADPAGVQNVDRMGARLRNSNPPQPVNIKRQRRWAEDNGDFDVERFLDEKQLHHREMFRERRHKHMAVSLMIDVGANCSWSHEQLMWRGAAAVVACDLLEESGFSCEVWAYDIGRNAYPEMKHHASFIAYKIKEAGDAVDIDGMAKAVSPWIFRTAVLASMWQGGHVNYGHGSHTQDNRERWFSRHCDVDRSIDKIWVPPAFGFEQAAVAVKQMIETIQVLS